MWQLQEIWIKPNHKIHKIDNTGSIGSLPVKAKMIWKYLKYADFENCRESKVKFEKH